MRQRLAVKLLGFLPEQLAAAPERVLLNLCCMLIGIGVLVGNRSLALDRLWPFPLYEWAVAMLAGGGAVLLGMFTRRRSIERLGLILLVVGCLFYGVLLPALFGWAGAISGVIFLAVAVAKGIRLLVSSVARSTNIRLGQQMEERPAPDEQS